MWSDDIDLLTEHLCTAAGRNLTEQEWSQLVAFVPYRSSCPAIAS